VDPDPVLDPAYHHFDENPDADFFFDADADPNGDPGFQNDAEPDPQHWGKV
jgi:hypothetical protein